MAKSESRIVIIVALITLVGTLGAAIIANWETLFPPTSSPGRDTEPPVVRSPLAPHAPSIEINQRYTVWGEQMMQFYLEPGESKTIKGMELYAHVATYPVPSCAGPGFVPYTWRIRQPYPQGGDLEIRRVLMGGSTEQVGVGSVGRANMGYCGEHTFQNNGIEKIYVELRYASAADTNE